MDPPTEIYLEKARERLVENVSNVVPSPHIVEAFRRVPRHLFAVGSDAMHAYEDRALPLAQSQTISQPSMIALMLEALAPEPENNALEVGAGSGYAAALLSELVRHVHAIELRPALASLARSALARAGVENVEVHVGDGTLGLPEAAPFDRILISAAAPAVPFRLVEQLSPGGRLVMPVGEEDGQRLWIGRRGAHGEPVEWERGVRCVFVPLVTSA